jgi:putative oxidoreductase
MNQHSLVANYSSILNWILLVGRVYLGAMIFSHGYAKMFRGGKLAGTAGWFESIGVRPGKLNALMASGTEMGVGVLLILGLATPLAAAGLISVMLVALVTSHRKNGWFIYNANGGGVEYVITISFFAFLVGSLGAGSYSIDAHQSVLCLGYGAAVAVTVLVGVAGALLQLAAFYRPNAK